uniref:Uncharacterized protein n=1 Tax=Cyclophora tenuis TaxID=216820 RepID=A0A7S1GP21_CYCTE|mmetsp:Transcript_316/g.529  ORF Transcript_316/g.529 Transcript_316/m.529 type:complete len:278 (+) Transcript_316:124-957(+)
MDRTSTSAPHHHQLPLRRRRVQFATTVDGAILENIIEPLPMPPPSMLKRRRRSSSATPATVTWCQQDEFLAMRQEALKVLEQVRNGSSDMIWAKARKYTYKKCLEKSFRLCLKGKKVSNTLQQDMGFWMSVGHTRRGLEKFILDDTLGSMRDEQRLRVQEGVLFVQDKCREQNMTAHQTERLLQAASELNSRPAQVFALHMGRADRIAVITEIHLELQQKGLATLCNNDNNLSSSSSNSHSIDNNINNDRRSSDSTSCTATTAMSEDDVSRFSNPAA